MRKEEPEVRFWRKVQVGSPDECWEWIGGKDTNGYGTFRVNRPGLNMDRAHTFSFRIHFGEIAKGNEIMHSCDNRTCVNPKHLSQGTHADNMKDASVKGRLYCGINWEGHKRATAA